MSPKMVQITASLLQGAPKPQKKKQKTVKGARPLLRQEELLLLCRARQKLPRHRQSFPGELHRFFNLHGPEGFT